MSQDYSNTEMMALACARRIKNEDIVFCGTGLPLLATMTAKMTHAPDCIIFFESGAMDPSLMELPLTVADPRVMYRASHIGGLADAFSFMQNQNTGTSVLGILSGAQIDIYGNLNSTLIGDFDNLDARLPGSGGACDVATSVGRSFIFMRHEARRFVETLDYQTSPGWLTGVNSRADAGLLGGGPEKVITTLGVLAFENESKKMYLENYYDFTTPNEIQDNTGFVLDATNAKLEPKPKPQELKILREHVDPMRLILQ